MGMWDQLVRVGIDAVAGYITTLDGLPPALPRAGHVPGSAHLNSGRVLWNLESLPREGTIVSYCQTGVRNSVAASALRRAGFDVVELEGRYAGWAQWLRAQGA